MEIQTRLHQPQLMPNPPILVVVAMVVVVADIDITVMVITQENIKTKIVDGTRF